MYFPTQNLMGIKIKGHLNLLIMLSNAHFACFEIHKKLYLNVLRLLHKNINYHNVRYSIYFWVFLFLTKRQQFKTGYGCQDGISISLIYYSLPFPKYESF